MAERVFNETAHQDGVPTS